LKKKIKIYTYLNDNAKLWSVLDNNYEYTKIDSYQKFATFISQLAYDGMYLFIVDIDKLKGERFTHFKETLLNSKHLFVIAYGTDITPKIKTKLHALEIGAVIDDNSSEQKVIFDYILTQANLHMRTFDNRFIKALLQYNDYVDIEKDLNYTLSFIAYKYNVSVAVISNIHLLFLTLFIAFKTDNISKISTMLHTVIQSKDIDKLYKEFYKAENFETKIICILLKLFEDETTTKYLDNIVFNNIDKVLYQDIEYIFDTKPIIVLSTKDINQVWERLFIFKYPADEQNIDIFNNCIVIIYNLLIHTLARVDYIEISFNQIQMSMHIKLFAEKTTVTMQHIKTKILSCTNIDSKQEVENEIIFFLATPIVKKTVTQKVEIDRTIIEGMHYKEADKISALEFLQEFEVEQSLLDELHELEVTIQDKLYLNDDFTPQLLLYITETFNTYIRILNYTIEFADIAYSLGKLCSTLTSLDLAIVDKSKIDTLKLYIKGLIDDLSNWKNHIFIEQNTPDIHYIDASLLENCITIENLLLSNPQTDESEDDEDDLEFF